MTRSRSAKSVLVATGYALIALAFITFPLKSYFMDLYYSSHVANPSLEAFVFVSQAIAAYSGCIMVAVGAVMDNKESRLARATGISLLSLALIALVTLVWAILWVKSYI